MSHRNSKQNGQSLMSQPPLAFRQVHDSDSERTTSASPTSNAADLEGGSPTPSITTTPPTHSPDPNGQRIFIRPNGIKAFEPFDAHWKIIESITRYFPEAVKTYNSAPQIKIACKWNPEDEAAIRHIYNKKAARRLSDTLGHVRSNLAKGKSPPQWMSSPVLAQYHSIWNNEEFKKTSEKNKNNRNSDCGGMGPSLHTGGSIPITEHRKRLKEKLGEDPSLAVLFQATHKRKKTNEFVCKKSSKSHATAWYEATGGVKKGSYVFGFGSDTQRYFPEVARRKKSRNGESSSHVACDEKFEQLDQTNKEILENQKKIMGLLQGIYSAHPELVEYVAPTADSNQSGDVGQDNLSMDDDTQSPT
nr:putative transposase En/Spm [Ipomoea batatas]